MSVHPSAAGPAPDSTPLGTPAAEVEIDTALVADLVAEQHPDLASYDVRHVESGWDNAMFRLGDELAVRLPRRQAAVACIENELRWLPEMARRASLPVPAPVRAGRPSERYPWPWGIVPWLAGQAADRRPLAADQASVVADFLRSIHTPPPPTAPRHASRGVPLVDRHAAMAPRFERLRDTTEVMTSAVESAWQMGGRAPIDVASTWIHGDLHARNVLARDGTLVAVVDWGDLTAGDPATDLAAVWMLLPTLASRRHALKLYRASPATVDRARAWAVLFGVVLLDTGRVDQPRHAAMGEQTLRAVAVGP